MCSRLESKIAKPFLATNIAKTCKCVSDDKLNGTQSEQGMCVFVCVCVCEREREREEEGVCVVCTCKMSLKFLSFHPKRMLQSFFGS